VLPERTEQVHFYSDGLRLTGTLYLPSVGPDDPLGHDGRVPAVVLCAGWVGGKYHRAPTFAAGFTARGIALLSFEYRGWGESEGDRTKLWPQEQVTDVRAAVSYLRQRPDIDGDRIALFGKEHGSAVATQTAADDPALRALICMFPVGDCARWMRSIRRPWEWRELLATIERDRAQRCVSGVSGLMDPSDILLVDPATEERRSSKRARSDAFAEWKLRIDSAEALLVFRPAESAHRLFPRPVLFVAVEDDNTVPIEEAMAFYAEFSGPRKLILLRGIEHYTAYEPECLTPVLESAAQFLRAAFGIEPKAKSDGSQEISLIGVPSPNAAMFSAAWPAARITVPATSR
jgi:alpha-beta hydrolase superfamily lysophospholipase